MSNRHLRYRGKHAARRYYGLLVAGCLLLAAAALCTCGYQMTGHGALPGNVNTIAVKILTNKSMETGAEAIVTNALSDELNRRRPGTIERTDKADAILSGTIDAIDRESVSRSGTLTATQRRLKLIISLALRDRSGKIIWKRSGITAQEDFGVARRTFDPDNNVATDNNLSTEDNMVTENNRRNALVKAAQRLAEDVYRALTDNF